MYLYIIRHGETYGNIGGDDITETDLSPLGEEQVKKLGERFRGSLLTKIYISPLIRALKTAEEIIKYHDNISSEVTSELFEQGTAPDYAGAGTAIIKSIVPSAEKIHAEPIGAEDAQATYKRAKAFIERIKAENSFDSHVAVVAHGSFNSFLVSAALDLPFREHFNFSHVNTGVSLIEYLYEDDGINIRTKLRYLNDVSHLGNIHRDIL